MHCSIKRHYGSLSPLVQKEATASSGKLVIVSAAVPHVPHLHLSFHYVVLAHGDVDER
jgi:hypothetical protein